MRRAAVLASIAALAGWRLLAWRRRAHAPKAPLGAPDRSASPPAILPPSPGEAFVSVAWTLVAAPPDHARLTIRCTCEAHMELDRVDAQETPTQVFVTVLMRRRPPDGNAAAQAHELEAEVALAHPLGGRELVHAPADPVTPPDGEPSSPPLYP